MEVQKLCEPLVTCWRQNRSSFLLPPTSYDGHVHVVIATTRKRFMRSQISATQMWPHCTGVQARSHAQTRRRLVQSLVTRHPRTVDDDPKHNTTTDQARAKLFYACVPVITIVSLWSSKSPSHTTWVTDGTAT